MPDPHVLDMTTIDTLRNESSVINDVSSRLMTRHLDHYRRVLGYKAPDEIVYFPSLAMVIGTIEHLLSNLKISTERARSFDTFVKAVNETHVEQNFPSVLAAAIYLCSLEKEYRPYSWTDGIIGMHLLTLVIETCNCSRVFHLDNAGAFAKVYHYITSNRNAHQSKFEDGLRNLLMDIALNGEYIDLGCEKSGSFIRE